MGYFVTSLTSESLLGFVKEEYDHVKWDAKSLDQGEDYIAIWGWCTDGTYEVALAYQIHRTNEEVEDILKVTNERSNRGITADDIPKNGWNIKVMNEAEGPVIQPSHSFIKKRPKMTLEGKRRIKQAEERKKFFDKIREIHTDPQNRGTIKSAMTCGNGQIFIWTTQGNYYIPESAYDKTLAMMGTLTVQSLKEKKVPMIPTKLEHPSHQAINVLNRRP